MSQATLYMMVYLTRVISRIYNSIPKMLPNYLNKPVCKSSFNTAIKKPPNILIRTDDCDDFNSILKFVVPILEPDMYTIYKLTEEDFKKSLWMESCIMLLFHRECMSSTCDSVLKLFSQYGHVVIYSEKSPQNISVNVLHDLKKATSGSSLSQLANDDVSANLHNLSSHITAYSKQYIEDLFLKINIRVCSKKVVSDVSEDRHFPAYLMRSNPETQVSDLFEVSTDINGEYIDTSSLRICFREHLNTSRISKEDFNIYTKTTEGVGFNWGLYKKLLKSNRYGRNIIYADVVGSTQTFLTRLNVKTIKYDGLVLTARQQTSGRGRHGNQWLSPIGCMMFSISFNINLNSKLGQNLPFVQHIAVIAFVKSIRDRSGYENLDINIKWPNDIYIRKLVKIGGVVTSSTLFNNNFKITLGMGVNIDNEKPTECLNSYLQEYCAENSVFLPKLCVEDVLAGTLSTMELLVDMFQSKGVDPLKELYYHYWIHSNALVSLECQNHAHAKVIGLDDYGFLRVQLETGEYVSLQPDGNSFDMSKNMIVLK